LVDIASARGKRVIAIAAENSDRLVRLVNDILELERLESGKISLSKQSCNTADLVKQATELMQVMANRSGITLYVSSESIQLNADSDRIIQVLTNLIGNAIKFSAPGTTISLTVILGNEENGQSSITSDQASTILFAVKDRGRGIPADKLETIFERFHQVDASDSRQKGGTGLGLAICRSIVQQHGGKIWANSILGEGSNFYFTLPID
jgi:signal transduction histidine kinase